MMSNVRYTIFALIVYLFIACSDDSGEPKGKYESGAFIVSEGGFGNSNATISHYNVTTGEVDQSILKVQGAFAGDVAQSLSFSTDRGYIVLNGDNKIQVVDADTFEEINVIAGTDVISPRYALEINGKVYISVWGPYDDNFALIDSYVLVYDIETNAIIKKIDTDEGSENLFYNGTYLFVTNYNYGASNTMDIIDPETNTALDRLTLSPGPAGIVEDENGMIWVVSSDWISGKLHRIDPSTLSVEASIEITSGQPGLDIALHSGQVFYTVGNAVYAVSTSATTEPLTPLLTADDVIQLYSFSVRPDNGDIWIGDAKDFTTVGMTYIYKEDGSLVDSFEVGISPTQFIFK